MKKSIFLFFAAILCAIGMNAANLTGGTVLYLKPNSNWASDNAWFAMYLCNGSSPAEWVKMTLAEGETNVYTATVPAGKTHKNVIFCRMNKNNTTKLDWSNVWNQSGDLTWDGTKNCCAINDGQWSCGTNVTWSVYTPTVTHTFAKNSTIYLDFRTVTTKGADIPKADKAETVYDENAGGNVIPVTFTADVKWAEGSKFLKTAQSGWSNDIPFKAPSAGQNCAQVAADGKSYTWTVYSEPSVTLSLDKTEADAGTEVTVTLTATADNVSGEVTYAFQYSTDNATWNNITATGNTATQTFAAETRYYKVTMTNGGTTKEATAKFSAIKFHVIGSWDEWAAHNEVVEGSKTITLEANKTYEYKITNGTWDLSWGNDGTMERSNCTDWSFESNNNAKIKTDEAGDYVFNVSRNAEGKVNVSVTYPEQTETPEPVVDVYTVFGSAALCGSDWNPSDASNDMTLVDGLYVWTKENVTLTGNTTFKIVKNHDYGQGEWPSGYGQNATIDISTSDCTEGGTYSIKITFDPTTGTITPSIESCEAAEEPIVHTYTIVGQAVLCESEWSPSDASNDMTLVDGLYVWTKENVELRSNAEFRIVKDHAYDEAYPNGGNYVIDLANYEGAAIYDVTITFNAETKEITVAMEKAGDVTPVVYTYYLMGVNGDWTTGIEMELNPNDANEYMLLCQSITADEPIKIKAVDTQSTVTWCAKLADTSLGTVEKDAEGNENIVLDEGKYNFYYKVAENEVWIGTATDCAIEISEEYDITITNLETEVPQPGFLALLGSESEVLGLSVQLFLNEYTGENGEYQLNEVSYLASDYVGELTFVSGSMTQEDYGTDAKIYTGTVIVELQGQYFQFNMTMYKKQLPTKTLTITGADLVVDLWNNITITAVHNSASVFVQFSDFEYVASKAYTYLMLEVGEWVDDDDDGVCDNVDYISELIEEATVTISGSTFTLKSKFEGTDANYDLTITGTLPLIIGEGDNSSVLAQNGQTADAYISRTFESGNLYTVSFPFAMNETTTKNVFGSRVEVYEYTSLTEETDGLVLNFTKLSTPQIAAGTPYLVKPNKNADGFGLSDVTISNAINTVTHTCASTTIAMEPVLTAAAKATTNGKTQYWLAEDNNLYNKSVNLKGLRAIFNVQTNKSNVRARAAFNENVETGVEDIFSTDAPVKVIVNGQLIIIRDGEMYNVQGQLVK